MKILFWYNSMNISRIKIILLREIRRREDLWMINIRLLSSAEASTSKCPRVSLYWQNVLATCIEKQVAGCSLGNDQSSSVRMFTPNTKGFLWLLSTTLTNLVRCSMTFVLFEEEHTVCELWYITQNTSRERAAAWDQISWPIISRPMAQPSVSRVGVAWAIRGGGG